MGYSIDFEVFKDFWEEDPCVVLDTNVLLDLYRASSQTTEDVLKNLNEIFASVWLPYQVIEEFKENQEEVKTKSYNKYHDVTKDVNSLIKKFDNELSNKFKRYGKFQFPKIHELRKIIETHTKAIEKEAKEFRNKVEDEIKNNKLLLREDPILKFVRKIEQEGNVGDPLSSQKLLEIFEEGERRYAYRLPPGYEDIGKNKSDSSNHKQFGDLIIWKSILEKSKSSDKPIIFITEDVKEDWWHLNENKEIIEPRKELVAEFNEHVGRKGIFVMLPLFEFLRHISVINMLSSLHAEIELNAENICNEIFDDKEPDLLPDLEAELVHDGQLDNYLTSGSLKDLEILEFVSNKLEILNVDFDENIAYIEGNYNVEISADIEEYYSKEYSVFKKFDIQLHGDFYAELELDFENDDYDVSDFTFKSPQVVDAIETHSEFMDTDDLCGECSRNEGSYNLYNHGKICNDCLGRDSYFVCTNCGTVYRNDDYNGDGETCQECR